MDGAGVSGEILKSENFYEYALPLVGEVPELRALQTKEVEKRLGEYERTGDREKPRGSPLPHHHAYGSVHGGSV